MYLTLVISTDISEVRPPIWIFIKPHAQRSEYNLTR